MSVCVATYLHCNKSVFAGYGPSP